MDRKRWCSKNPKADTIDETQPKVIVPKMFHNIPTYNIIQEINMCRKKENA